LTVQIAPREALFLLEVWGDAAAVETRLGAPLPAPCRASAIDGGRVIWWEPQTWLARVALADQAAALARLTDALGGDGTVTDVSGAYTRIAVSGPAWRDLMMIGGVFDAESPSFGPGSVAATVIHHLPVRLDVIGETAVEAYVAPSYAGDLLHHWGRKGRAPHLA
jgi:heterotetrameric sarcosine oxidase gamma subunit